METNTARFNAQKAINETMSEQSSLDPAPEVINLSAPRAPDEGDLRLSPLERDIVQAVTYADVFDFPLTAPEIRRSLRSAATISDVQAALSGPRLVPAILGQRQGYYFLVGRAGIIDVRQRRTRASAKLWPQAHHFGRQLARLPFVRMVAVTGALAVDNSEADDDIDYLVITAPSRLWLTRALAILLVKHAARQGVLICPNYFLSERALALAEQDLFAAHELAQMVPLAGFDVYQRMLVLNSWAASYLPNAFEDDHGAALATRSESTVEPPGLIDTVAWFAKRPLELFLRLPPGGWIERWEMSRKIAKFNALYPPDQGDPTIERQGEVAFSPDYCKGHFNYHGQRILATYSAHLEER